MMQAHPGAYDLTWSRRHLVALTALCVAAAGGLAWRCAQRRARLGDEIAVRDDRVRMAAERIDPNTATVASLRRLPGIGPTKAQAIVAERRKRRFCRTDDLTRVHGIGPKTLRNITPLMEIKATGEK